MTADNKIPERGSDAWKTYVANAIAKAPDKRTEAEKAEIAYAMTQEAKP